MTKPYLHIQALKKTYNKVTAIEEINIAVQEGEFLTFLGPSGSGKSTVLYILAGFQQPDSGTISFEDNDILKVPSHKRNLGMVFQRYTLFPHLSVSDNIAFPLKVRKVNDSEIASKVKKLLKLVRLEGFEDRMPANMSGGQQQRVALARALIYDPPVLLMDEPLSALDKNLREEIQYEIKRIHNETQVTILYVTHDQEEALRLSDRIAVFNKGKIEQIDSGKNLYNNPSTKFIAEFMGDSDLLKATVEKRYKNDNDKDYVDMKLPCGHTITHLPLSEDIAVNDDAFLMLRPERLSLSSEKGEAYIAGKIADITFLGNATSVLVITKCNQHLRIRVSYTDNDAELFVIGKELFVNFDADDARVYR